MLDFVAALRRAGVPTTQSEAIDAFEVLAHIPLVERAQVRAALAAVLVRSPTQRATFDAVFELYFPVRIDPVGEPADGLAEDLERTRDQVAEALERGDPADLRARAREAVAAFGAVQAADGGVTHYQYRVLRSLDIEALVAALLAADRETADEPLATRVRRDRLENAARILTEEIARDVARRTSARQGAERASQRLVTLPVEERDFFHLAPGDHAELRVQLRALARQLATRSAVRRRQARRGRLDVRRTVRRSLATGGVPFTPAFRRRPPHRPELFVLCDVSGSVAAFARFTLTLVHALHADFSAVRSFAFVDALGEITEGFGPGDGTEVLADVLASADVVRNDGRSDYGASFVDFHREHADAVGPQATVLVLGDARNNFRPAHTWVLDDLRRRARHVYWLNPEPRRFWDSGDSLASRYARHVDHMTETRNLSQLAAFVTRLASS